MTVNYGIVSYAIISILWQPDNYDNLLSFCSPYHLYSRCLAFTDILALEIDVHYMIFRLQNSLRFNLRASIFQKFPGGHVLDPLALACYACFTQ